MEEKSSFKPFIPAEKIVPEFTATSIVIGVILAVLFGGANARGCYLNGNYPRHSAPRIDSGK